MMLTNARAVIKLVEGLVRLARMLIPFLSAKFPIYNTILYALKQLQFSFSVLIKECACESLRHQLGDSKGFPQTVSFLCPIMSDVAWYFEIVNLKRFLILNLKL